MEKRDTKFIEKLDPANPPDASFWEQLTLSELAIAHLLCETHPIKKVFLRKIIERIKGSDASFTEYAAVFKEKSIKAESELGALLLQKMFGVAASKEEWVILSICEHGPIRNTALDNLSAMRLSFEEWLSLRSFFPRHRDLERLAKARMRKLTGESEDRIAICTELFPESTAKPNAVRGRGNMTPLC